MLIRETDISRTGISFKLYFLNDNEGGGYATYISCVC
jgi:hypothetical protein